MSAIVSFPDFEYPDIVKEANEEFVCVLREASVDIRRRWCNLKLQIQEYMAKINTKPEEGFETIKIELSDPKLSRLAWQTLTEDEIRSGMMLTFKSAHYLNKLRQAMLSKSDDIMVQVWDTIQPLLLQKQPAMSNVNTRSCLKRKRPQAGKLQTEFKELKQSISDYECTLEGVEAQKNEQLNRCYKKLLESVNVVKEIIEQPISADDQVEESVDRLLDDAEVKIEAVLKEMNDFLPKFYLAVSHLESVEYMGENM